MRTKIIILGGGIAGLAAGYFLSQSGKYEVTILEQAPFTGGLCGSFEYNGFTLDYGAHKMYSTIPGILEDLKKCMGQRLLQLPKKNRIYLKGHLLDYPLKLGNLLKALGLGTFLKLGFGYAVAVLLGMVSRKNPVSYEDYMKQCFGAPTYELVFEPLADKVWGDPSKLHAEMARTRVPATNGLEVILRLLGIKKETTDTNADFFYYPKKGFGDFPNTLKKDIEDKGGKVICSIRGTKCHKTADKVTQIEINVEGQSKVLDCDYLISTIPLPVLSRLVFADKPVDFKHFVDELQFRHLNLVFIEINRPLVLEDQWIFFPEKEYIFSRIFEQKQMNPELGPKDKTVICCDFTCDDESWQWKAGDDQIVQSCIDGLVKAGFIKAMEVNSYFVKRYRNFYPRYDVDYVQKIQACSSQLQQVKNLLLTGRLGMYNYNNSDHCFDMAKFISHELEQSKPTHEIWQALEKRVTSYRIVD